MHLCSARNRYTTNAPDDDDGGGEPSASTTTPSSQIDVKDENIFSAIQS